MVRAGLWWIVENPNNLIDSWHYKTEAVLGTNEYILLTNSFSLWNELSSKKFGFLWFSSVKNQLLMLFVTWCWGELKHPDSLQHAQASVPVLCTVGQWWTGLVFSGSVSHLSIFCFCLHSAYSMPHFDQISGGFKFAQNCGAVQHQERKSWHQWAGVYEREQCCVRSRSFIHLFTTPPNSEQ